MLKTWSVEAMSQKNISAVVLFFVGMFAGFIFMGIGKLVGDQFFVIIAQAVFVCTVVAVLILGWAIRGVAFCAGNVLVVGGGTVYRHYEDPFFYNKNALGAMEFVPFSRSNVVASRTLYLPVDGKLLVCWVECEGSVTNFQRHYDLYLSPMRKEALEVRQVIQTCIATFLQQNKEAIVDELRRTGCDDGTTLVPEFVQEDALRYLRKEMNSTGFTIYSATVSCSLKPLIIS